MHLRTYLDETGETDTAFAARVCTTSATIGRICTDVQWPKRSLWQRIFAATNGRVVPTDHLNLAERILSDGTST